MRKLVIAQIKAEQLVTVGSAVESELCCLGYADKVWYEKGFYHIRGREHIKRFVDSMLEKITEMRTVFKDEESIKEFDADEKLLISLLKIKAI